MFCFTNGGKKCLDKTDDFYHNNMDEINKTK